MAPSKVTRSVTKPETNMNGSGAGRSTRSTRALLNDYEPPNTKPASPAKKAREPRTASAARHKVTERLKSVNLPDTTVDVPHRPRKRAFPRALDDDRPAALPGSQRGKLRSVNVALTAAPPSPSQAKLSTKARAASGTQQLAAPGAMKWLKEPTTAQPRAIRARSQTPTSSARRAKRQKSFEEVPTADSTPQPLTLFSLPSEIHVKILLYVDVADLRSFRTTCRRANDLSKERQLWSYAYRILAQRLPPPVNVTPSTAMTSRELEQTVCYMLKLDRNWRSIAPVPIRNKPLRRFASDPEVTVDDIYLIPGGRWLLILTRESITLWDVDAELLTEPTATVAHFENSYEQSYMVVDSNDMPTSSNVLVVSIEDGRSHVDLWHLALQPALPETQHLTGFIAPFPLPISLVDRCLAVRSDILAFVRRTPAQNYPVTIDWRKSTPDAYNVCCAAVRGHIKPHSMQLLPHGRVLLLSDEQLTIHNMPTFSVAAALDALSPFNVDALWSLDLIHGPTLDPISNLWMFEDFPSDPDTSCILCIIAPAFRCTVRVPLSHASHLEVKHALFRKPTFEGGTDIAFYRGVVKVNSSGLISFVENLDNWVHVEDGVTSIRGLNTFDYPITSGVAPVDVTQTTFDQGSGRVCVLNRFSNDLEVLDFV